MIKTSRTAYDFACSLTGFGHSAPTSKETICTAGDATESSAKNRKEERFDPIDYSRFANIGDPEDDKKQSNEAVRRARDLVSTITGDPPAQVVDDEHKKPDSVDTSEFFDLRKSVAMQGCAHDRSKERALYERPNKEKLHLASRFRVDGNTFFQEKDYDRASNCYLRGLIQLEYTFPDNPEEEKLFNEIKLALHLNQAAAKLNAEDYDECAAQCEQALKIDQSNAKAYYRKAQCHIAWCKYDSAVALLQKSSELDPSATEVCNADIFRALKLKHAKDDHTFYENLFRGLKKL